MPVDIILPRVDMDMATGKISRWFVTDGEHVTKGQLLFEIETDKAAMDVDSPLAGTIRDIQAATGVDMPVGTRVARLFEGDEVYTVDTGAEAAPVVVEPHETAEDSDTRPPEARPVLQQNDLTATPMARRLARERGVDLAAITGSGPLGRVQAGDVEAFELSAAVPAQPVLYGEWLREGEGLPLVLVHGFGADLNSWRAFVAAGVFNRPVFAVDLPGHGRSALGDPATLVAMAARLAATLAAQGISTCHLIAHSLGGAVALQLIKDVPACAASLVLLAPAGLGPEIHGDFIAGFLRAQSRESLRPWLAMLFARDTFREAFLTATVKQRGEGAQRSAQVTLAALLFPDSTQIHDARPVFDAISVPVRVIWGVEDRIIPARQAMGLPGSVGLHLLPRIGHLPHIEARDLVARLVRETLRSAEG